MNATHSTHDDPTWLRVVTFLLFATAALVITLSGSRLGWEIILAVSAGTVLSAYAIRWLSRRLERANDAEPLRPPARPRRPFWRHPAPNWIMLIGWLATTLAVTSERLVLGGGILVAMCAALVAAWAVWRRQTV